MVRRPELNSPLGGGEKTVDLMKRAGVVGVGGIAISHD